MFLLVSVRHVGAHPGEHQYGVSIQISISLGKTFLRISRIRNIPLTWILARVFAYLPPFISQILDFIYWTVLIFLLFILNGVTLKTSNITVKPHVSDHPICKGLVVAYERWSLTRVGPQGQNEWYIYNSLNWNLEIWAFFSRVMVDIV